MVLILYEHSVCFLLLDCEHFCWQVEVGSVQAWIVERRRYCEMGVGCANALVRSEIQKVTIIVVGKLICDPTSF